MISRSEIYLFLKKVIFQVDRIENFTEPNSLMC